jgi:aminoglycoside phosphotransferase (APT) family kinase protein
MDRYWELTIPYYELDMPTVQRLLHAVDRTCVVEQMVLLPDGKRNTNYQVRLRGAGKPYLLRIFGARDTWWEKEVAIHGLVKSRVPVPELYVLDASASVVDRPYAVYEYLDGITLDRVTNTVDARIFTQLGEALAKLHTISYEHIGFFDRELKIAQI